MSETETMTQGSGTYDLNEPRSWDLHAASGLVVGLDQPGSCRTIRPAGWCVATGTGRVEIVLR